MRKVMFADTPRDFLLYAIGETIEGDHSILWIMIGEDSKKLSPNCVNFREWLPIILGTYERTGDIIRAIKIRYFISHMDEIEKETEFIKTHFYEDVIPWDDYYSS